MKRIQIGFAAIIAALAMSFTIAEHNGIFKNKSVKVSPTDCFLAGGTNGLKIRHTCTSATITISVTDPCSVTTPGDRVWSLDANNSIPSNQIPIQCPGQTKFCCFQVTEDTGPCASPNTQPGFDIGAGLKPYKVNAVYCKD